MKTPCSSWILGIRSPVGLIAAHANTLARGLHASRIACRGRAMARACQRARKWRLMTQEDGTGTGRMPGRVLSWLLALGIAAAALFMLVLGARLLLAGGSWYYVITGAALIATAYGLARGRRWWAPLFGTLLAGTLIWSLGEAGLDGW